MIWVGIRDVGWLDLIFGLQDVFGIGVVVVAVILRQCNLLQ